MHRVPEKRKEAHRHQRRLMSPILKERPALVCETVEQAEGVGPQPGVSGKVVGSNEDVYRIDLERAQPAGKPQESFRAGAPWSLPYETLRVQSYPACL